MMVAIAASLSHAELPRLLPTLSLPGDSADSPSPRPPVSTVSSRRKGDALFFGLDVGEPFTQTFIEIVPLPERTSTGLGL